jgi:hypothetical protein
MGTPVPALAQAGQANPSASSLDSHEGLMIGFSLGGGAVRSSACEACDMPNGAAVDASLGWFVNPRLAVMLDVFALTTADAGINETTGLLYGQSTANALAGVGVQYWPAPRFWVKGSVGYAKLLVATVLGSGEASGGGMTLGAGVEVLQRGRFAIDLQGRLSHSEILVRGVNYSCRGRQI